MKEIHPSQFMVLLDPLTCSWLFHLLFSNLSSGGNFDSGCDHTEQQKPQQNVYQMEHAGMAHGDEGTIICSPSEEENEEAENTQAHQPVDDFIAVKVRETFSRVDVQLVNLSSESVPTKRNMLESTDQSYTGQETQQIEESCGPNYLQPAVCDKSTSMYETLTCEQSMASKKVEDEGFDRDDDEYLHIVRGITSVPHDFAPERVVVPVYTVPRYPDNHNPLLPLSLQKKLGVCQHTFLLLYLPHVI